MKMSRDMTYKQVGAEKSLYTSSPILNTVIEKPEKDNKMRFRQSQILIDLRSSTAS